MVDGREVGRGHGREVGPVEGPVQGGAGAPVIVRVVLEDRPGALGAVASRIGAVGADVVGVEIIHRGDGHAVDELWVLLPEEVPMELLQREINEVDRVRVEQIRPALEERDPLVALLSLAVRLSACAAGSVVSELIDGVRTEFGAAWSVVLDAADATVIGSAGPLPPLLEVGGADIDALADAETAVAPLGPGALLALGRPGIPFRRREREALRLLTLLAADRRRSGSLPPGA